LKPTDISQPDYFHVVDCQWACPAHTPFLNIRLIAAGRHSDAYDQSAVNVFPGILGHAIAVRTCVPARPRRGR
jgi:hypothetical protein